MKEKLEHAGIKPSEVMRTALSDALEEADKEALLNEWKIVRGIFKKIPEERITRGIREDRER
ncbi:MAG TPA: hypothetical protein VMW67_01550 [Desulfobacteria bacterium]|nr:hypothetical protein [Desulfobacteria bacterium]